MTIIVPATRTPPLVFSWSYVLIFLLDTTLKQLQSANITNKLSFLDALPVTHLQMTLFNFHTNQYIKLIYQWIYLHCFETKITGGSETNTLCMPYDIDSLPSDFPTTTYSGHSAHLYGSEYQFTYKNVAIDDDVPCTICKVTPETTTMMDPAKLTCPQNWTLQYHDYLDASHFGNYASEFIYSDNDPRGIRTA